MEELPLGEFDVEVLESTSLKILTSLHRLKTKLEAEMRRPEPVRTAAFDLLPNPKQPRLSKLKSLPAAGRTETITSYCWVLVRRIGVRLEKLRVLAEVMRAKRVLLGATPQGRYQELLLVGTLKMVTKSIDVYEELEARSVLRLCKNSV